MLPSVSFTTCTIKRAGAQYSDIAELSHRIFAAALQTGIGLTHLPVLYTYGEAGQVPLSEGQLRFGNSVDEFLALVDSARAGLGDLPNDARIGIAPHSLRATSPDDLQAVLAGHDSGPIHIHIAEQPKEVADIEAWLGARPVDWLLNNAPINRNWCLIHATHMTDGENGSDGGDRRRLRAFARSQRRIWATVRSTARPIWGRVGRSVSGQIPT